MFDYNDIGSYTNVKQITDAIIHNHAIIKLDLHIECVRKLLYRNRENYKHLHIMSSSNMLSNILNKELGINTQIIKSTYTVDNNNTNKKSLKRKYDNMI